MQKLTRREFLRVSAIATAGTLVAACAKATPEEAKETPAKEEPKAPTATTAPKPTEAPAAIREAPDIHALVEAGSLPPLEERLPHDVEVVKVENEVGQHGGVLRTATISPENYGDDTITMGCEGLLRTSRDAKGVDPNVALSWDFSEDGKMMTLHLRKGMKWSDGEPFTADDIMFWYEDMLLNKELTPSINYGWQSGGEVIKVERLDDLTVTYTSAVPHPAILLWNSPIRGLQESWGGFECKHYLKQFHVNYTDEDELMKLAEAEGYDAWYKLFNAKRRNIWGTPLDPEQVTVCAYEMTEFGTDRRDYSRNPYYCKTDPDGNQLPYFDGVTAKIVQDREMINNLILTGQVDTAILEASMENYPLYGENEEAGGYDTLIWTSVLGSDVVYQPNQTIEEPVLREIFRDVRFRRALSLAMNRDEINEALYFGMATPRQHTVIPESKLFEEEFAASYAQYDPDEANRLLDEMGLEWDSNHEFRLRPDGERLAWLLEYFPQETPKTPTTEIVVEHWRAIGCDVTFKEITGELGRERYPGNLVQMGLWHGDYATDILFIMRPSFFGVPCAHIWSRTWDPLWSLWYQTDGQEGEEPIEEVKAQWDRWQRYRTTMDESEQIKAGKEILASQAENLWTIGTVGLAPHPVIRAKKMGNFPDTALHGWDVVWSCHVHPEQFYFKQT